MTTIITYDEMKNYYEEFKGNPPENEFEKYYQEYSYAKNLIEFAKKEKLKDEIKEYEKIQQHAMEELKNSDTNLFK